MCIFNIRGFVGKPKVDTSKSAYRIVVSFIRDDGGVGFATDLCMHASTQLTPIGQNKTEKPKQKKTTLPE